MELFSGSFVHVGMGILSMHPVDRPRERLFERGAAAASTEELLAILLRTGYRGASALEIAQKLLVSFPRGRLAQMQARQLAGLKGIGPSRAAAIVAAAELGRRWALEEQGYQETFDNPRWIWENLHEIRSKRQEHFVAFYLNARLNLIHRQIISMGTLTGSVVHPREAFAPAIEYRAAAVIVAHNHPSGDVRPSREDRRVTRRLACAGRILGIGLLDHVIVTETEWFSFRQEGRLR